MIQWILLLRYNLILFCPPSLVISPFPKALITICTMTTPRSGFPAQTCLVRARPIYSHYRLPAGYSFIIFLLSSSLPPLIAFFMNTLFHLIQAPETHPWLFPLSACSLINMSSRLYFQNNSENHVSPFPLSLSSPGLLSHLPGESCASPVHFLLVTWRILQEGSRHCSWIKG